MIAAYLDTAYLLKLYWPELGSEAVRALADRVDVVVCSLHGRAELITAAHRKLREAPEAGANFKSQISDLKSGGTAALSALLAQVAADQAAGAIAWLPITEAHLDRVATVVRRAPATVYLRAADALHLASAAEAGFAEIYSNDRHLLAAAPLFGLRGIDVIGAAG